MSKDRDWLDVVSGAVEGAGSGLKSATAFATSKKEAKEAKRRTLANLLSQAMKRNQGLSEADTEHQSDMKDFQSQVLQNSARGFANAMQGSTRRRK